MKRRNLVLLATGLVIGAAAALAYALMGGDPRALLGETTLLLRAGVGKLEALGPVGYYAATALLATAGAPVSILVIAGGAAFGGVWGVGGGLVALAASASLSHLLSLHVLEGLIRRLLAFAGRQVPKVSRDSERTFALIVRITPGLPFVVQNYVLALGGVRLRVNLACLLPIQMLYVSGFVFLGDAFAKGHAGKAVAGVGLLVAGALLVHWIRGKNATRLPPEPKA